MGKKENKKMAYTKKQIDEITEITHEAIRDLGNKALEDQFKIGAIVSKELCKKGVKNANNTKTH